MFQLVINGMRGRKKDTRVLALVIALSFLFLTVGTILLSSFTYTQLQQRQSLYGAWQLLYAGNNEAVSERLGELTPERVEVAVIGQDESAGSVGVWTEEIASLGGLTLAEGRFPENENEILLEKGQLGQFTDEIGVGSTVTLQFQAVGTDLRAQVVESPVITIRGKEFSSQQILRTFGANVSEEDIYEALSSKWSEEIWQETTKYADTFGNEQEYNLFGEHLQMPVSEMTDEAYLELVEIVLSGMVEVSTDSMIYGDWIGYLLPEWCNDLRRVIYSGSDGDFIGWKLNTTFEYYYSNNPDAQVAYYEDIIQSDGAIPQQDFSIWLNCEVVGILETVADRWDIGRTQLPNCYITETGREAMLAKVEELQNLEDDNRLYFDDIADYTTLNFYLGGESASTVYEEFAATEFSTLTACSEADALANIYDYHRFVYGAEYQISETDHAQVETYLADQGIEGEIQELAYEIGSENYYTVQAGEQLENGKTMAQNLYLYRPQLIARLDSGETVSVLSDYAIVFVPEPTVEAQDESGDTYYMHSDTIIGYRMAFADIKNMQPINGWEQQVSHFPDLESAYTYNNGNVLINRYGFPMDGGLTESMGTTIIAVLMAVTICAVFQIFFTQLRRRTRKLTLLKSVGATGGQILQLLGWECLFITVIGLEIGDALGLLLSYGIVMALDGTIFCIDWTLLLTGQLCGILSVVLGMMIPSIRAMNIPLVGRMEGKKRRHVKVKAMKKQSWGRICIRDLISNPGRTAGTAALCVFLVTMELICVFLGNASFDAYRETIVWADKPDYTLSMGTAGSRRMVEGIDVSLAGIQGMERRDFYRVAHNVMLWYDGQEDSPVLNALKEVDEYSRYFGTSIANLGTEYVPDGVIGITAYKTRVYGVESDSDLFTRLEDAITVGSIDKAKYDEGDQVIVLCPLYCPLEGSAENIDNSSMYNLLESANVMSLSLNSAQADSWYRDESLKLGQRIVLGLDAPRPSEAAINYRFNYDNPAVGAIIYYFPEQGIWPFSEEPNSFTVIGSAQMLGCVIPDGFITRDATEMESLEYLADWLGDPTTGEAHYSFYATENSTPDQTLSPLFQVARAQYMTLSNYADTNRAVYDKALSACLLIGALALAATMVVWLILSNTLSSAQEQGRKRSGILQALGVTKGQCYWAQALQAVGYWIVTVVISNLLMAVLIILMGAIQRSGQSLYVVDLIQMILREDLVQYPWMLHWVLCLVELPILLIFHLWAARIPAQYSPIDNIRS